MPSANYKTLKTMCGIEEYVCFSFFHTANTFLFYFNDFLNLINLPT